jgi:hypothetical protein
VLVEGGCRNTELMLQTQETDDVVDEDEDEEREKRCGSKFLDIMTQDG